MEQSFKMIYQTSTSIINKTLTNHPNSTQILYFSFLI